MKVSGNGAEIPSGDTTPSTFDVTNFGSGFKTKSFTISNDDTFGGVTHSHAEVAQATGSPFGPNGPTYLLQVGRKDGTAKPARQGLNLSLTREIP